MANEDMQIETELARQYVEDILFLEISPGCIHCPEFNGCGQKQCPKLKKAMKLITESYTLTKQVREAVIEASRKLRQQECGGISILGNFTHNQIIANHILKSIGLPTIEQGSREGF